MNHDKEISDTLKAANIYLKHLKTLTDKVHSAEEQISITSLETEDNIEVTFNSLIADLTKILNKRKEKLIKTVQQTKQRSLAPFEECLADIFRKIENTQKLITEGDNLLQTNGHDVADFNQKSSFLGSLPEIPELKEVPYISFQYEPKIETDLRELCSGFGEVSKIAPIQISQMREKPGAILVEWQSVENEDRFTDVQEFRLQRAFGDVIKEKHLTVNFQDCFIGLDSQFLVKDLKVDQIYSFRVCCKFEGSNEWSPWSQSETALTTIKPFSWKLNQDFRLADENRIATPLKEGQLILLSDGPQMSVGYSVEFTYLEYDNKNSIIGLIVSESENVTDIKSSSHSYFTLESSGEIFVDGVKKATKLQAAKKGLKVCFTCELIHEDKVMVNIDACDKRVTYDWHISRNSKIYFAAQIQSPNTKIMVE